eukprot:1369734-Amphidinium_carterae.1
MIRARFKIVACNPSADQTQDTRGHMQAEGKLLQNVLRITHPFLSLPSLSSQSYTVSRRSRATCRE